MNKKGKVWRKCSQLILARLHSALAWSIVILTFSLSGFENTILGCKTAEWCREHIAQTSAGAPCGVLSPDIIIPIFSVKICIL